MMVVLGKFEWEKIFRDATVSKQAKALGLLLTTYAGADGGNIFPTAATMARQLGYSDRDKIRPYINELKDGGWVTPVDRTVRGVVVYRLSIPSEDFRIMVEDPDDPWSIS